MSYSKKETDVLNDGGGADSLTTLKEAIEKNPTPSSKFQSYQSPKTMENIEMNILVSSEIPLESSKNFNVSKPTQITTPHHDYKVRYNDFYLIN